METKQQKDVALSRRNFIATAGAVAAGGVLAAGAMPQLAVAKPTDPGPLPWPWVWALCWPSPWVGAAPALCWVIPFVTCCT